MFYDYVKIYVKAGDGGNGVVLEEFVELLKLLFNKLLEAVSDVKLASDDVDLH